MTLRGVVVWFAKAGAGALAAFGALVLVVVLGASALFGGGGEKPAAVKADQAVVNAEGAAAVGHAPASEKAACLCSAGASCAGPRGGVYCLTDAGARRYLPRP